MEPVDFGSSEGLGQSVSDHISALAVDKTEGAIDDHLLTEPVVTRIEVLHARGRSGCFGHLDARSVVFEHGGGPHLGKAHVRENGAHADGITSRIESGEVLSMSSARGDGGLAPADVMDAGASNEGTVSSGGSAVVEASAVVGQEVAVDVVVEGLRSATKHEASVRSSRKPA